MGKVKVSDRHNYTFSQKLSSVLLWFCIIYIYLWPTRVHAEFRSDSFVERSGVAFQCGKDGFFRDPYNCTIFYRCADITGDAIRYQLFRFDCPLGTAYDEAVDSCNHPSLVPGCDSNQIGAGFRIKPSAIALPGSRPLLIERVSEGGDRVDAIFYPEDVARKRCRKPGLFRSPEDCRRFYICVDVFGNTTMFQMCEYPCPDGTVFSDNLKLCTEPEKAEPCPGDIVTIRPTSTTLSPAGGITAPTPFPDGGFRCTENGYFRHPLDCTRYFQCTNITVHGHLFQRHEFICAGGTVFDPDISVCNHPADVRGCEHIGASTEAPHPPVPTRPPVIPTTAPSTLITTKPTRPVTVPTTPPQPPPGAIRPPRPSIIPPSPPCYQVGYFRHPSNCSHFYRCINLTEDHTVFQKIEFVCGLGSVFDQSVNVCNHPDAVPGCGTVLPPVPPIVIPLPTVHPPTIVTLPPIRPTLTPVPPPSKPPVVPTRPPVPPVTSTQSPKPPTRPTLSPSPPCYQAGYFRHPTDCTRFYRCNNLTEDHTVFQKTEFTCGLGSVFDESINVCNHPANVPGCEHVPTLPPVRPTQSPVVPTKPTYPPRPPTQPTLPTQPPRPPTYPTLPTQPPRPPTQPTLPTQPPRPPTYPTLPTQPPRPPTQPTLPTQPPRPPTQPTLPTQPPRPPTQPTLPTQPPKPPTQPTLPTQPPRPPTYPTLPTQPPRPPTYPTLPTLPPRPPTYPTLPTLPPRPPTQPTLPTQPPKPPTRPTQPPRPPTKPPTRPPKPPVLPPSPPCYQVGYFRHPTDCTRFYRCSNLTEDHTVFQKTEFTCGLGSVFDESVNVCNHPANVPGCEHVPTLPPRPPVTPTLPPRPPVTPTLPPRPSVIPTLPPRPSVIPTLPPRPIIEPTYPPVVPPLPPRPPTKPPSPPCRKVGYFRHPTDCTIFYHCINFTEDHTVFHQTEFKCGLGSVFDESISVCNHPANVPGCEHVKPTSPLPGSTPPTKPTLPPQPPVTPPRPPTRPTLPPQPPVTPPKPPIRPTLPPQPPVTPPRPPTILPSPPCNKVGFFRHPFDCTRFYRCANLTEDHTVFQKTEFTCGLGSVFDESISVCTHPENVPGCEHIRPPPLPPVGPSVIPPIVLPVVTTAPITLLPPVTGKPIAGPHCYQDGFIRHPTNCSIFYRCVNASADGSRFIRHEFECGHGTVFDLSLNVCNFPEAVPECASQIGVTIPTVPGIGISVTTARPTSPVGGITVPTTPSTLPVTTGVTVPGTGITIIPLPPDGSSTQCHKDGFFRHPNDCGRFTRCIAVKDANNVTVAFSKIDFGCGSGTVFDETILVCNHPSLVPGCEGYVQVTTPCVGTVPPVTQPSVTHRPITQPPATHRPITQPPATHRPVTQPPATHRPVTQPPATHRPVTQPPATHRPVTQPPATHRPVTQPPATHRPVTQPPATHRPVTQPPATHRPVTTWPLPGGPSTISPPPFSCSAEGQFRHPQNCSKFYRCVDLTGNGGRFQIIVFDCPVGTLFDETIGVCNHAHLVNCQTGPGLIISPSTSTVPTTSSGIHSSSSSTSTKLPTASSISATSSSSIVTVPAITSSSSTTVSPSVSGFVCVVAGKFEHVTDCTKFYLCQDLLGDGHHFHQCEVVCPQGTIFDSLYGYCVPSLSPNLCIPLPAPAFRSLPLYNTVPPHFPYLTNSRMYY